MGARGGGMGGCGGYITEIMFSIHKFFSISNPKNLTKPSKLQRVIKRFYLGGLSENVTHKTFQESF